MFVARRLFTWPLFGLSLAALLMQFLSKVVRANQSADFGKYPIPTRARLASSFYLVLAFALLWVTPTHAYQRSYLNLGFESPVIDVAAPCRVYIANTRVPGWSTTHPFENEQASGCNTPISVTGSGQLIEIWYGPRAIGGGTGTTDRVPAREGNQFVELNANAVSELTQNICLVNGEPVTWRFSHNGRNTANDTLVFRAGSQPVANVSTSMTGAGAVTNCYAGSCAVSSSVLTQDGVTRWADYTGTFTYTGPDGQTALGFQSTSGSATNGNFLDGVQITVKPIIEFTSSNYSTPENNGSASPIQVIVAGIVPAGGLPLTFNVTGGTALLTTDYTINGGSATTFNVTVPAGDYGQGTPLVVNVPVTIVNDLVNEADEFFTVTLAPDTTFHLMSTSVCGASGFGTATYNIIDDDAPTDMDLRVVKSQRVGTTGAFQTTPLSVVSTSTMQYRLVITNQGVATVSNSSLATFTDAIPASITGLSVVSSTGSAGATTCTSSLTGSTLNGTFSGPTNAVCTIAVQGTATTVGTITNTATVTTPAGNTDIFPSDNTSSVQTTIARATLRLNKITNGDVGTFSYTLTNTAQTTGSVTTTFPGSSTQVDGDTGDAGTQAFAISTAADVTINEPAVAGWTLGGATCTNGSGTTVGALVGTTYTILNAQFSAGDVLTCTFLNRKNPTIQVEKISYGGTGAFTFAATNLTGTIGTLTTTASATPVLSAILPVTAINTAVTITETPVATYTLTTASCIDENSAFTGNIGTFGTLAGSVLTVPASYFLTGAEIKCTFNNRRSTTLTLRKTWAANSQAPHTATVTSTGFINNATSGTSTATPAGNTTTGSTAATVYVGESGTISEIFGGGAVAADYNGVLACTGTNGSLSGNTLTITQSSGTAITCTYTNTKLPKITLTKVSNGGVGAFSFTGNNGFAPQTITTVTAGTGVAGTVQTLTTIGAATTITETIPSGYLLTAINCTGLGTGTATNNLAAGSVTLNAAAIVAGANIACTFTNTKQPLLRINKTVSSLVNAADRFTTEIRAVSVTDPVLSSTSSDAATGGGVLTTGGAATYSATGSYQGVIGTPYFVTESITAGTSTLSQYNTSIACTNSLAGSTTVLPTGSTQPFTLTLAAGDNVTCTLTNSIKRPTVTLTKLSQGGAGTFTFTGNNG